MTDCADCRDGGHGNYDEDVLLVTVRDPDTGRMEKRAYLCGEHRDAYRDDGFEVEGD